MLDVIVNRNSSVTDATVAIIFQSARIPVIRVHSPHPEEATYQKLPYRLWEQLCQLGEGPCQWGEGQYQGVEDISSL